ncbi:MAG: AarF/ABC1/UbiB kinase family protein [Candidatus Falkowbacteria bacterium]|nr:AarF/ABC1/UbiB kinase family protein [Candidatus Falkowbacteria bacterium]
MNTWQSLWLVRELYYKKGLPNLKKIQSLGLLAVKIGQIHALRLDFLSAEKCQALATLYRSNNPVPAEEVKVLLLEHGGASFTDNFSLIEEQPLATASVGQVYKAKLKNGSDVVIKVIKARFKKSFSYDIKRLRGFFKLVLKFNPKLKSVGNPLGILDDIETYTLTELDLRNEAKGAAVLEGIYLKYKDHFDLSMLKFQKIYKEYSGENILVSEFINAPTVDELLTAGRFSYEDMLKFFYLQGFYIFIAGKFHGDVHPGNILYDGKQFYFVDMAFIGEVSERIRRGLFFFFEALSFYNYDDCAKYLNEMAEIRIEGEAYEKFKLDFKEVYKDYAGKTVSQASLTKQMMLTIKLGVNSGMVFEKGIFAIIRSLMYLDGMVLKCNPNAILMEDMRQFIQAYKKEI